MYILSIVKARVLQLLAKMWGLLGVFVCALHLSFFFSLSQYSIVLYACVIVYDIWNNG